MKQHITEEQLNELTHEQNAKLHEWWGFPKGCVGHNRELSQLLTIGKLIEFLQIAGISIYKKPETEDAPQKYQVRTWDLRFVELELCDGLWQAVKEVLKSPQ